MDKRAQAIDTAARRAIIKLNTPVDMQKRANFLKGLKNLFKPQTVGRSGTDTGTAFLKRVTNKSFDAAGKSKGKSHTTSIEPSKKVFDMSPAGLLGVVAGAVILNQFVKNMIDYGRKLGIKMMEPKYYNDMLKENPGLLEHKEQDVAKLWGTLYQTSPHLASDPVAAGAFIVQNLKADYLEDYGGPPLDTYKTLTGIENSIQSNNRGDAPDTAPLITGALTAGGFS